MEMTTYLAQEALVLNIKELAVPGAWAIKEYPSMIMMDYTDRQKRKVEIQFEKTDCLHYVRIDGVRDLVHTDQLLSVLSVLN